MKIKSRLTRQYKTTRSITEWVTYIQHFLALSQPDLTLLRVKTVEWLILSLKGLNSVYIPALGRFQVIYRPSRKYPVRGSSERKDSTPRTLVVFTPCRELQATILAETTQYENTFLNPLEEDEFLPLEEIAPLPPQSIKLSNPLSDIQINYKFLLYLKEDLPRQRNWTHPMNKLTWTAEEIRLCLKKIKALHPVEWEILYGMWLGSTLTELSAQHQICLKTATKRLHKILDNSLNELYIQRYL
jgi:nucleoid DNA-binding protein